MDHLPFVLTRARDSHIDISGHALMASCPAPSTFDALSEEELKGQMQMPDNINVTTTASMPDLLKLLDLSSRLPLDGEITPVMAWAMILGDERCGELTAEDVGVIKEGLLGKIRCYGYVFLFFLFLVSSLSLFEPSISISRAFD